MQPRSDVTARGILKYSYSHESENLNINIVPEDEVSLRVMRDDLGRGEANKGGGQQQRDDLGGENLSAAVALELRHSSGEL